MVDLTANLKIGNKYTLACFKANGFPQSIMFTLRAVEPSHGGYSLSYRPSMSMMKMGKAWLGKQVQFVLWDGWVDCDTALGVATLTKDFDSGHTRKVKRYTNFNPRYMQRAKLSVKQVPLAESIHLNKINDVLLDLCTIHDFKHKEK